MNSKYPNKGVSTSVAIITIILCALIVGGIATWQWKKIKEGKPSGEEFPVFTSDEKPIVDIKIPKDRYKVGELFSGEYYMKYSGDSFKGIVMYCETRENYGRELYKERPCSLSRGMIKDIDFDNPQKTNALKSSLAAFRLNENEYTPGLDYFYEEGKYTFSIFVYSCPDIEKKLNKKDCGGPLREISIEKLAEVKPLASVSKSVIVSGGEIEIECETNSDCIQVCEGCKKGKQICEQGRKLCMDCFMDMQCKEEYKCKNNRCVEK